MSGLEIVASIAGVASAAIKISVTMNDIAEDLGSAGRDVRYISNEMACFSQVLRLVHSSLEDSTKVIGSSIIQSALNTLPQLIEQCGMVHEEANGLMVSLRPPTSKESSMPFIKRVRFIFQKSRITVLRSLLDSSKSTLNLLLVTLNIEMAKMKTPSKELMDQLQSERKVFIRVVASQSRALDEALKEVEKAKKETAKLKSKADKETQKQQEKDQKQTNKDETDKSSNLAPPAMYSLPAPSVTQFVYTPPAIDTTPQTAVMSLALSLEPARPSNPSGMASPPSSPSNTASNNSYSMPRKAAPNAGPYGAYNGYASPPPPSPQPPYFNPPNTNFASPGMGPDRPETGKRVFSDPGPAKPNPPSSETLHPGAPPRERSRSPYGFSRVPKDDPPEPERKRSPYNFQPSPSSGASPTTPQDKQPQNPASPDTERKRASYSFQTSPTTEKKGPLPQPEKKPEYKAYQPPPPSENPASPNSPNADRQRSSQGSIPLRSKGPPPLHGTTYIALASYTSREIGHLNFGTFDTLVDLVSHISEEETLPYPTAFDSHLKPIHYWQASLHHRRGPRGLLPHDIVCPIDDEKVDQKLKEAWFSTTAQLVADMSGRVWVGPRWSFEEPKRRRSKWWAEEF